MVAAFLAAEATSQRYGPQIREILAGLGHPRGIVEHPDTSDAAANAVRRQVLADLSDRREVDQPAGTGMDVADMFVT